MADVTLAELNGQMWVVGGEEHLDALLFNDLPEGVAVRFVTCATHAEMFGMWPGRLLDEMAGAQPWLLNTLIAARIRNQFGLGQRSVTFTPWSAMLDGAAQDTMAAAAAWLAQNPGGRLVLRQFAPASPVPGLADLQRLRAQLGAGALAGAGVAAGQVGDEMGDAEGAADTERLDILTEAPAG